MTDRRQTDHQLDDRIRTMFQELLLQHEQRETGVIHSSVVEAEKKGGLERHAQTILISVITAAILFSATFMYNSNSSLNTMTTKMEFMSVTISKLEAKIDAMNSNYVQKPEYTELEKRVRELEKSVSN